MFLQFCECVWRLEPHTWNVNGQDFSCIAIIQFPTHFPYRQIQQLHLYAKVTTDHKKSPVYFNVTSPRIGGSAQQGDGTLQRTLQCWCTKALPERNSAPFLFVCLSFLWKRKKWKKRSSAKEYTKSTKKALLSPQEDSTSVQLCSWDLYFDLHSSLKSKSQFCSENITSVLSFFL